MKLLKNMKRKLMSEVSRIKGRYVCDYTKKMHTPRIGTNIKNFNNNRRYQSFFKFRLYSHINLPQIILLN
jgi:hypothetical protein